MTAKLITRARITEEERGGKDIYIYIFLIKRAAKEF